MKIVPYITAVNVLRSFFVTVSIRIVWQWWRGKLFKEDVTEGVVEGQSPPTITKRCHFVKNEIQSQNNENIITIPEKTKIHPAKFGK